MANKKISLKFENYNINVNYKNIKCAKIIITEEKKIVLNVPFSYTKDNILTIIDKNKLWIKKKLNKIKSINLKENEVLLFGKIYTIYVNSDINKTEVLEDRILTPNLNEFENFKKELAKIKFKKMIEFYLPYIGKKVNRLSIKKMKTRWGSCNFKKGYINLNLNLLHKDVKFIEYVVLHELTHLIYPHHRKEFYDFIKCIMPDYKARISLGK